MNCHGTGFPVPYLLDVERIRAASSSQHRMPASFVAPESSGNKNASNIRDIVAKRITSADIYAAQELTREFVRKNYKGC